jgi:hypothetical protein
MFELTGMTGSNQLFLCARAYAKFSQTRQTRQLKASDVDPESAVRAWLRGPKALLRKEICDEKGFAQFASQLRVSEGQVFAADA